MTRRLVAVRLGQFALLAAVGWLGLRPVAGTVGFDWPRLTAVVPGGQPFAWGTVGDPLPWLRVTVSGNPDEFLYLPDGRPGFPSVVPNHNRLVKWEWEVANPFAPVVGLLFALCLPPLLADAACRTRWNRWPAVGLAAAAGGLVLGTLVSAVEGGATRGLAGETAGAVAFARDAWRGLRPHGWDELAGRATLVGLLAGGGATAARLRPWRSAPPLQPHAAGERPG